MQDPLGSSLVRAGFITAQQLEDALRDQVLTGGRLGSNLVDLGYLTPEQLAAALAQHHGLPVIAEAELERTPPHLFGDHTRRLAAYHKAIPLGVSGRTVEVGMVDPGDVTAREAVEALSMRALEVRVVPESLFWRYVERHHDLRRPTRISLDDPMLRLRPRSESWQPGFLGEEIDAGPMPSGLERNIFEWDADLTTLPEPPAPRPTEVEPMAGIMAALGTARDRDALAAAVKRWAQGRVEVLLLFVLGDDAAVGWSGLAGGLEPEGVSRISIPLERPSAFHEAFISGDTFAGRPPAGLLHDRLDAWLGRVRPAEVRVAPVRVEGRLVNMVYLDDGERPLSATLDAELAELCEGMAAAYARLLRAAKSS